ncbi:glycosyltransferase family 4 protein [Brucellaceae bacterium D45D]
MKNDKLRLWVDGQCLQTGSRMRGIGRYVQEFLAEIAENHKEIDLHISLNAAMANEAIAARDFLQRWVPSRNIHVWHGVVDGAEQVYGYNDTRRLSEVALSNHVVSISPDLALSASPFEDYSAVPLTPYFLQSIPTASIFYDAIPLRFPDHYLMNSRLVSYFQRRISFYKDFDINLCISDFARDELVSIIGNNNAVSIGAGVSKDFLNLMENQEYIARDENTLLYVGGFDWRKNVPFVIDAISMIKSETRDKLKFIAVGYVERETEIYLKNKWKSLGLCEENLFLVGHVSDKALMKYYQRASALIQPSLMEGFGLTALEAILCDTPVMASRAGALPEIIIDDDQLFDPSDVDDIAKHIERFFDKSCSRIGLSLKAKEHAKNITWERAVKVSIQSISNFLKNTTIISGYDNINIVNEVKKIDVSDAVKIGCLSRSEGLKDQGPRLIVDATLTVISNAGTGIQRVVTKICDQIVNDPVRSPDPVVAFSNTEDGWYAIPAGDVNTDPVQVEKHGKKIVFTQNDHVLMLDSSWLFYAQHSRNLARGRLRGTQVTSCLYDLVPLKSPGFTHSNIPNIFSQWFKAALTYSTGFVCISRAVADELIALLESIAFPKPIRIGYWPLGADFSDVSLPFLQDEETMEKRPSFLMVGTLEPRKGHRVALDAFDELWRRGADVQLTIVGKLGWNAEHLVNRMQSHPEWNKRLFWNPKVTDTELSAFYVASDCLISTSFAEGFGLPIVEAGYFGKPIIASDIEVFREVSSKSHYSLFFEMGNAIALADSVEKFISVRKTIATKRDPDERWENWAESAAALKDVILNDKWYHVYQPKEPRYFADLSDAVNIRMRGVVGLNERQFELSLADGPLSAESQDEIRYVIKVTNLSQTIWSSLGEPTGESAIRLAARLFGPSGELIDEARKSSIPYVIVPHDTVYMPIEVPISWKKNSGAKIHVELVQEGAAWWGNPAVISTEDM